MLCKRKGIKEMQERKIIGTDSFHGLKTFFDKKSYKEKSYLDLLYYIDKIRKELTVGVKYDIFDRRDKKEYPRSKFLGFAGKENDILLFQTVKGKYKISYKLIDYALNEVKFVESNKIKK